MPSASESAPLASIADKRRSFQQLHATGCFAIPNPWWVGSARYLQSLGFKALASTSAGLAWSRGLGAAQNEIAQQSGVGMLLQEAAIPVLPQVAAACELLGLDPLYIANEGKLVAIVAPEAARAVLAAMRAHPLGQRAAQIGQVSEDANRFVQMSTAFGGRRVVDWLSGEPLPRIC